MKSTSIDQKGIFMSRRGVVCLPPDTLYLQMKELVNKKT